jgi:hypothetical protein
MSTVIKQIILESVDFRFDPDSEQLEMLVTPQDLEFLVEMVVRECIQVGGPEDSYPDDWFKAKADSVNKIKQHFGVEE